MSNDAGTQTDTVESSTNSDDGMQWQQYFVDKLYALYNSEEHHDSNKDDHMRREPSDQAKQRWDDLQHRISVAIKHARNSSAGHMVSGFDGNTNYFGALSSMSVRLLTELSQNDVDSAMAQNAQLAQRMDALTKAEAAAKKLASQQTPGTPAGPSVPCAADPGRSFPECSQSRGTHVS
mgnify:CR=1 FL=1